MLVEGEPRTVAFFVEDPPNGPCEVIGLWWGGQYHDFRCTCKTFLDCDGCKHVRAVRDDEETLDKPEQFTSAHDQRSSLLRHGRVRYL